MFFNQRMKPSFPKQGFQDDKIQVLDQQEKKTGKTSFSDVPEPPMKFLQNNDIKVEYTLNLKNPSDASPIIRSRL